MEPQARKIDRTAHGRPRRLSRGAPEACRAAADAVWLAQTGDGHLKTSSRASLTSEPLSLHRIPGKQGIIDQGHLSSPQTGRASCPTGGDTGASALTTRLRPP